MIKSNNALKPLLPAKAESSEVGVLKPLIITLPPELKPLITFTMILGISNTNAIFNALPIKFVSNFGISGFANISTALYISPIPVKYTIINCMITINAAKNPFTGPNGSSTLNIYSCAKTFVENIISKNTINIFFMLSPYISSILVEKSSK